VLAVGDAEFQKKCLGKMGEVSKGEGRTVLFVSHNMAAVQSLCTTGILLEDGRNIFNGKVNFTLDNYLKKKSSFIGYRNYASIKQNYFKSIETFNENNELTDFFYFSKKITLKYSCVIKEVTPDTQIGIALLDRYNSTVFTLQNELIEFSNNMIHSKIEFPSSILAPGTYNFRLALWTKSGSVYESIEGHNQISIIPDEGNSNFNPLVDYGVVILNPNWENEVQYL
jgi:lipopolysaccharide transport system ATP-binding protein